MKTLLTSICIWLVASQAIADSDPESVGQAIQESNQPPNQSESSSDAKTPRQVGSDKNNFCARVEEGRYPANAHSLKRFGYADASEAHLDVERVCEKESLLGIKVSGESTVQRGFRGDKVFFAFKRIYYSGSGNEYTRVEFENSETKELITMSKRNGYDYRSITYDDSYAPWYSKTTSKYQVYSGEPILNAKPQSVPRIGQGTSKDNGLCALIEEGVCPAVRILEGYANPHEAELDITKICEHETLLGIKVSGKSQVARGFRGDKVFFAFKGIKQFAEFTELTFQNPDTKEVIIMGTNGQDHRSTSYSHLTLGQGYRGGLIISEVNRLERVVRKAKPDKEGPRTTSNHKFFSDGRYEQRVSLDGSRIRDPKNSYIKIKKLYLNGDLSGLQVEGNSANGDGFHGKATFEYVVGTTIGSETMLIFQRRGGSDKLTPSNTGGELAITYEGNVRYWPEGAGN